MGRHAAGWKVRLPKGRTVWLVRFQHEGRTVELSTGERDRGEASRRAAELYAEVVTGRVTPRAASSDLVADMAAWLADYGTAHAAGTGVTVEGYARGLLVFFGGYGHLTAPGYAEYARVRIAQVSRSTLRKELSALRMFAEWAKAERGIVLPAVPGLPKRGHPGARSKHARRRSATILSAGEIARILVAMPVRGRGGAWRRPFFALMWETGLRPYSTLARLEAPLHYRRGAEELFISREIDKARYERTVPLTPAAREALDLVVPDAGGLLFPAVSKDGMRSALAAAVARAGGIKGAVSVYDFRHSRTSYLANSGAPLAGVAFLMGHKHISTTALYVRSSQAAAVAALAMVCPKIPGAPQVSTAFDGPRRGGTEDDAG